MIRRTMATRALGVGLLVVLTATMPHPADAAAKKRSSVTATLSTATVTQGKQVTMAGRATRHTRRTLAIQRYAGGHWVQVAKGRTLANGRYRAGIPTAAVGTFSYRAYLYPDRRHRAAVSRVVAVQVRAAQAPPNSSTAFSYLMGEKYRWNPCTPITYMVNPNGAPADWAADVTGALQRVTSAAGLRFQYLGTTTAIPQGIGTDTTANLLIAYLRPGQSPLIPVGEARNGLAGKGGAAGIPVNTASGVQGRLTGGTVALNLDIVRGLPAGFGKGRTTGYVGTRGQLLMHEIGHAMGLGHVNSEPQIMYPQMGAKYASWGAGDLAGLTSVGAKGGCLTPVPAPNGRLLPTEKISRIID